MTNTRWQKITTCRDYVTHKDNINITKESLIRELKAIGLQDFFLSTHKDNGKDAFVLGDPIPPRKIEKGISITLGLNDYSGMDMSEVKKRLTDKGYIFQSKQLEEKEISK